MVESTSGSPAPRAAVAQGQVAYGCSPYHSVTPTGMVPSAITGSCSVSPTVTTRSGSASMVVSPRSCSMVTGYAAPEGSGVVGAAASGWSSPQAARPALATRPTRRAVRSGRVRGRSGIRYAYLIVLTVYNTV